MHPVVNLPTPAAGDVFTHNGNLNVTNAAANIFVVYDCDARDAEQPSSSLTVDFVMGNVYLIDASLFGHWGSNRVFGNLVKGLGLQLEGRLEGDRSVDTVYDDVVCVVNGQLPTSCAIGTIAGNLVTVSDLTSSSGNEASQVHSVTTNYIYGCHLLESHLSYGGGLQRAYSAWASMTFLPVRPFSLPANGIPFPAQNSTSHTSHTLKASLVDHHDTLGLRSAEQEVKQLRRVVDDLFSRITSGQATATADQGSLQAGSSYTQQISRGRTTQRDVVSGSGYQRTIMCANCCRGGHEVKDCIGPVDVDGFISACPICNVRDHPFSSCHKLKETKKKTKKTLEFLYLVQRRQNKPPIRSTTCWISVWAASDCPRMQLPHTKDFAQKIGQGLILQYPDWRTYDYSAPLPQRDATNAALLRDPSTEYESGRPCSLFPGTQGMSIGEGYNVVRAKMHRLGINLLPNAPNPATLQTKKMKKQAKRNQTETTLSQGDGSRFATGANCTIVQRPLPVLPPKPVFTRALTINIKQEEVD